MDNTTRTGQGSQIAPQVDPKANPQEGRTKPKTVDTPHVPPIGGNSESAATGDHRRTDEGL